MSAARRRAASAVGALVAAALLAGALAGCVELPGVSAGECGNGVIEPPEDCDGFDADSGAPCLPKGAVGECHLSCSRSDDGQNGCPEGWGCDLSGICRRPTGGFEPPRELEVGSATVLSSGDFDGDGHADIFSAERPNPYGVTRVKVHFFDDQGTPTETRLFSHLLLAPTLGDLNGDGRRDLVFADNNIGLLLGRADRSMVPETFSSYRLPRTAIRTCSVIDQPVQQTPGFVVLAELDGIAGLYVPDAETDGTPRRLATLPGSVDGLIGDPAGGDLIEGPASPCREVVVAVRGGSELSVFDICGPGDPGEIVWRADAPVRTVALDPPEPITIPPQVVDVDGDGHLDILVGSDARAFVAYGDGQALAPAVPLSLVIPGEPAPVTPIPMPLAVGDVTGDGAADYVFPEGFVLSSPSTTVPGQTDYADFPFGGQGPFTAAAIADLNANGFPDIIAASSQYPGFSFFNGTGTKDITFFAVPTNRPPERLAIGDFDGNLVQDLAFTQSDADDTADEVLIAFGAPFAPPTEPVAVARLGSIDQLASYTQERMGGLVISSTEGSGEDRRGALTLLAGSGDHLPVASYELTTFAADTSVNGAVAARAVGGAFLGTAPGDVVAVAFREPPTNASAELWLLPDLVHSAGSPVRLAGTLPPEARPLLDVNLGFSLAAAAADLDGDGRDEALIAVPVMDDEHCALLTFRIEADRAELLGQVVVAEPCEQVALTPVHADADGRMDVAWLTSRADGSERRLSLFWNDGVGGLSSERRTLIADPASAPQAFALLPASPARGPSVVVATASGLERLPLDGATRQLGPPETLLELPGVTGLTAGDLNGDGAVDLAAASRGNLTILGATLESR